MSGWEGLALSSPGAGQWQAEPYPPRSPVRRGLSTWRILVLCLGVLLTAGAALAAWFVLPPATIVQTRIVADGSGPDSRAALAEAELRLQAMPAGSATLDGHGDTLVITAADEDPAVARQRARSIANALLNLPLATAARLVSGSVQPGLVPDRQASNRAGLMADRNRLQATLDAMDGQIATISASLTGIARDIAAGARSVADHKPGHETLDKATAALTDLQLQRIQLQSRYQDDYPAITALDGQIRSMRSFLQDEQHRVDAGDRTTVDPGLATERDRLHVEMAQLIDRRSATAGELASATRALANAPVDRAAPVVTPTVASPAPPAPMLIEASTTISSGPDFRAIAAGMAGLCGLLASIVAWFKPRRSYQPVPADLLLQRLEAVLLPGGMAVLPEARYSTLARAEPTRRLHSSPTAVERSM